MGDFRIEINAVGGHGCQRDIKDGGTLYGCGLRGCPDCELAAFLQRLQMIGTSVKAARLTHWPGQPSEVVDTFAVEELPRSTKRTRKGSF